MSKLKSPVMIISIVFVLQAMSMLSLIRLKYSLCCCLVVDKIPH